ncbi:Slp family lipoprotein [Wenzhouxiangella sp. XN79A]|uniref:Slp family lipoprotein n=1 Tax=Wenzhouxiangella sp. XN79A TaxID=2724193 RepID=UPI00144A540D|nr:Slp family lipoprotein [Wenzhouxiangella sp. XN79A]NKI33591.1 Slp family lipoprotein [Wenzhouxiangella sp. XN79A]
MIQVHEPESEPDMRRFLTILALVVPLVLSGCVSIPEPLAGDVDPTPLPDAVDQAQLGRTFLWGGTLVVARPGETETCLEILARPLDSQRRPRIGDLTHGRFRACHEGFLDPEIFAEGREVTVVGELREFVTGPVGEYSYRFPRLATDTVHLWPERRPFDDRYYDPFWRYHGWPYWPYGGPYWIHRGPRYVPIAVPTRPHPAPAAPRQPAAPAK